MQLFMQLCLKQFRKYYIQKRKKIMKLITNQHLHKYLLPHQLNDEIITILADIYQDDVNGDVLVIRNHFLKTREVNHVHLKHQRIKQVKYKNSYKYYYSQMKPDNSIYEEEIPSKKFDQDKKERLDETLNPITKTRHIFKHGEQICYIDSYEGCLMGLHILSIKAAGEPIRLPCKIQRDISNDEEFTLFSLAKKKSSNFILEHN
jgi:CYTH domain-containing protein